MKYRRVGKICFFESQISEEVVYDIDGLNYVELIYNNQQLTFLLDTGASVSIFFKEYLGNNELVNSSRKTKISGISGSAFSQGSANIKLHVDNVTVGHEFLLMQQIDNSMQGILGADFFVQYKANINFETYRFSFYIDNRKVSIPIHSHSDFCTYIPPRCEIIKYFKVDSNKQYVVVNDEVSDGVFVASSLVLPDKNSMIPVRILNVRDEQVRIKNFKPRIDDLENYNICKFDDNSQSVERIERLLNLIKFQDLSKEEKMSLQKICAKFSDVFHLDGDPLTITNIFKQKIYLKESTTPIYTKPYKLPYSQKDEIHKQVDDMIKKGIIEETRSEWSSPLLIVPKKLDNSGQKKWRVVIDYRQLNKHIEDDRFPLPSISEILDSLSGAMYFSHLDLSQGYYQIELDPSSRPYTAFTTDRGQYQMTRVPMGLKTSPSGFSRAMTLAMSGLSHEICFIYLDDLIVFGNNLTVHNRNLAKVLQRLRNVNLKLNPSKCEFMRKEILYLGHIISSEGISPDPEKISTIKQYPQPQNADQTKRFIAFANYYRRFIKNFAHLAAPLNHLTRKGVTFTWTNECQTSFLKLKECLANPPVLQYPDFSDTNKFILKTDASGYALGAVLSNSDESPIAFASRSLNKSEKNYSTIEKELLSITWAVKHFRPYLYGRHFTIFTDHRPLIYLFGMTNPSSRLTKFRLTLEEYDYTIHYIKGKQNVVADALSRIEITSDELKAMAVKTDQKIYAVTTRAQKIRQNQQLKTDTLNNLPTDKRIGHPGIVEVLKCPDNFIELRPVMNEKFKSIFKKLNNYYTSGNCVYDKNSNTIYIDCQVVRSMSTLEESLRHLKHICMQYQLPEVLVVRNNESAQFLKELLKVSSKIKELNIKITVLKGVKIITDLETRQLIINDYHILPTGGHAGIKRTYNNIKKHFSWNGLGKDVENFIKHCDDCQRYKHSKPNREPMSITSTASSAFEKILLDIVGPIETDSENNRYILTLQCDLTKFVEGYPLENKETVTIAKAFVNNFILRYGIPTVILTDQGTEFMSSVFKEVCQILGINKLNSTSYHHQTIGSLENSHKSLKNYLRIQISKHPETWSSWIPFWCFSYNNSVHTETKYTPYELVFGKVSILPSNVTNSIDPMYAFDNYPIELKFRLQTAWQDASKNLVSSKVKRKQIYDKKTNEISYKPGSKVLLKNESGNKVECLFKGPYFVVREDSPNITLQVDNKNIIVHKDRIKPYYD